MALSPFAGTYSDAVFYPKGTVVAATAGGVLWQALHDSLGESVASPYFADVSAVPLELTHADLDPSADDGVDAAIGSTFADLASGFYVKTAGSAGDWYLVVDPA